MRPQIQTDYLILNFDKILKAKQNGGVVEIPLEELNKFTHTDFDMLEKYIFNTPDLKLKFYKEIKTARDENRPFLFYFTPPYLKEQIKNIKEHFKKYPNLNYILPADIYRYPLDFFPEKLYNEGIISKEDIPVLTQAIAERRNIVIKPKKVKPPIVKKEELLSLVYPTTPFDDFFKPRYQSALSQLYEQPLDPSVSWTFISLPFVAQFPVVRGIIQYPLVQEVGKEVIAPALGYKDEKEKETIGEILSNLLFLKNVVGFALRSALPVSDRINLFRKITTSHFYSGSKLKQEVAKAVARGLGLSEELAYQIPKFNEPFDKYLSTWVNAIGKPLTGKQMEQMIDFMSHLSATPDDMIAIGRIWRMPSLGGVNPLQWAQAVETVFGKGAGMYIDVGRVARIPIFQFTFKYSIHRPPEGIDIDFSDVTSDANRFVRPYILPPKTVEVPSPLAVIPKTPPIPPKPPITPSPPVPPVTPPKPPAKPEVPITPPKPKITPSEPTHKIVIPHNFNVPAILIRLSKAYEIPLEKFVFKKLDDESFGFEFEKSRGIIKFSRVKETDLTPLQSYFYEIPIGAYFTIEREPFNPFVKNKFEKFIENILSKELSGLVIQGAELKLLTPHFVIKELYNTSYPEYFVTYRFLHKDEMLKYFEEAEKMFQTWKPQRSYLLEGKLAPIISLNDEKFIVLDKKVYKALSSLFSKSKVNAVQIDYCGEMKGKANLILRTNKKIIITTAKVSNTLKDIEEDIKGYGVQVLATEGTLEPKVHNTKELSLLSPPEEPIVEKEDLDVYYDKRDKKHLGTTEFGWEPDSEEAYRFLHRLNILTTETAFSKFADIVNRISQRVGETLRPKIGIKRKGLKLEVLGVTKERDILVKMIEGETPWHEFGHYLHNLARAISDDLFDYIKKAVEQYRRPELFNVTRYVRPVFGGVGRGYLAYRMRFQELFADYTVMYLLAPDLAEELAPQFTAEFEKIIKDLKLDDIINRQTAEIIFSDISPQKVIASNLAEQVTIDLHKIAEEIEDLNVRQYIKQEAVRIEDKLQSVFNFFLDTTAKVILANNPTVTRLYLELNDAMVRDKYYIDHETLTKLKELASSFEEVEKLNKQPIKIKEKGIERTIERPFDEAFGKLMDYFIGMKREVMPTFQEVKEYLPKEMWGIGQKALELLNKMVETTKQITVFLLNKLAEIDPVLAQGLRDKFSKNPNYLPLSGDGKYMMYFETEIEIDNKKVPVPMFTFSDNKDDVRKYIENAAKLGWKYKLYDFDGYYTVVKYGNNYSVIITEFDYETHQKALEKFKNKLLKQGYDITKLEIIDGGIGHIDRNFFKNMLYPLSFDETLAILERRGVKLTAEQQMKLYETINPSMPNLFVTNFRLIKFFTPVDMFNNILFYQKRLVNYITNKAVRKVLVENEAELNKLKRVEQDIIRNMVEKGRADYSGFTSVIGSSLAMIYLDLNFRWLLGNFLQGPQFLKFLFPYDPKLVLESYADAEYTFITGKGVGKYKELVERLVEVAEKRGEFETAFSQYIQDYLDKAILKLKPTHNPLELKTRQIISAFHRIVSTASRNVEYYNRKTAYLTAIYLGLRLYERGKYPKLAGYVFEIDPTTPEGIKALDRWGSIINSEINIKYNPAETSPWGKSPLLNLTKLFLTFPSHFTALDIDFARKDVSGQVVDQWYRMGLLAREYDAQKKKETLKKLVSNFYTKLLFLLASLAFIGITPFREIIKRFRSKKDKIPIEEEVYKYIKSEPIANTINYGLLGGLLGIDITRTLTYYDTFLHLIETFPNLVDNLVAFRTLKQFKVASQYGKYSIIRAIEKIPVYPLYPFVRGDDIIKMLEMSGVPLTKTEEALIKLGFTPIRVARLYNIRRWYLQAEKQTRQQKAVANEVMANIIADMYVLFLAKDKMTKTEFYKQYHSLLEDLNRVTRIRIKELGELTMEEKRYIRERVEGLLKLDKYLTKNIRVKDRPYLLTYKEIIMSADSQAKREQMEQAMKILEERMNYWYSIFSDVANTTSVEYSSEETIDELFGKKF